MFALILVIEGSFGYYKNKNKKVVIKETPDINIQRDNGTTILNIIGCIKYVMPVKNLNICILG